MGIKMSSQTFGLMFKVNIDGTVEPLPWSKEHFNDDNIIIVLDEYNQLVWIYYGKRNGIVTKRKAYRQADSLRGHGYTVGNSIIGRNLTKIIEIDQRKIERVPETTEAWNKLLKLLDIPHVKALGECVALGVSEPSAGIPAGKPKPAPAPASPAAPEPSLTPAPESQPAPAAAPASTSTQPDVPAETVQPTNISQPRIEPVDEYSGIEDEGGVADTSDTFSTSTEEKLARLDHISKEDELKAGILLMALLRNFADIYISKKGNHFAIESLEGPICEFTVENGKIKFSGNSFQEVDPGMKKKIQQAFIELSK